MEKTITEFRHLTTGCLPVRGQEQKPVIGLSVNIAEETSRLHEDYIASVTEAGGIPILIPALTDPDILRGIVGNIDGLILTGGADVAGEYFGETTLEGIAEVVAGRDEYDFLLLRLAADRQLPVFGICRGMQVINIAYGGDIWQDIPSQYPETYLPHNRTEKKDEPAHEVEVNKNSLLYKISGREKLGVNSRHHQAVRKIAEGFRVSATAADGIVEAIEGYPVKRIFGVQWHPENMAVAGNQCMKRIFGFFILEAALYKRAKSIHRESLTVDSHCDTPMLFGGRNIDIGIRDSAGQVDLVKMGEGLLDAAFVAAYLPQTKLGSRSDENAFSRAVSLLGRMKEQIENNIDYCGQAVTFADAQRLKKCGKRAIFLAVENGLTIGRNTDKLLKFHEMGVVYITLCHNGANDICDSAIGEPLHGGLSPFGREVVAGMNRLGIAVDLSHAAQTTFYDVLKISNAPVICSHSSVKALCDHPRNLSDEQITALAANGGVVQICLYDEFLKNGGGATMIDAADHIEYVANLVGAEHVGIGSDFDGGGGIPGCNGSNEIINLTVELLRHGYTDAEVSGILGGNFRRVIDAVRSASVNNGI